MPLSLARAVVAAGLVFSQAANSAAACWCLEAASTAVEDPPQLPTTCAPAVHCGSSVMDHLPVFDGDAEGMSPGAQTSETHAMNCPSFIPLSQAAVHCG